MILTLSDTFRKLLSLRVPSRCLYKFKKGFSFPGAAEVRDDPEDDAVTTLTIGKAGHGAGAAAHFAEGAVDDVGGAHLDPVSGGNGKKFNRASRSRSTQATAAGRRSAQRCFQSRKARGASL